MDCYLRITFSQLNDGGWNFEISTCGQEMFLTIFEIVKNVGICRYLLDLVAVTVARNLNLSETFFSFLLKRVRLKRYSVRRKKREDMN